MAHRAFLQRAALKMQAKRRQGAFACAPVADLDLVHWLGVGGHRVPDADIAQQSRGRHRQRIGPTVKGRVRALGCGQRVDQGDAVRRLGESQGQGRAVQATANDGDICVMFHASQYGGQCGIVHAPRRRYRCDEMTDGKDETWTCG